jgi:pyridoxamine 5'-phosphate oxidase-like protein
MPDERFRSLLEAASPAVLTTYRRDGSALASPVWFRLYADMLEVVIAEGDIKLKHLAYRPECFLTVFEVTSPFRGLATRRPPQLVAGDVTEARLAIASRYLGARDAARFAAQRKPHGTLLRLPLDDARAWDLSAILPGI